MDDIIRMKVAQASRLLGDLGIPLWIAQFARETYEHPDPVQRLVVGTSVTWPAAFIIRSNESTTAIVGMGDVANVEATAAYDEVIGYVQDIGPILREVLVRADPERVGLSYSADDDQADALTVGMHHVLLRCLEGTPYAERLVSADGVLSALRARKSPGEVERIADAAGDTVQLFEMIEGMLPAQPTEREVADAVHRRIAEMGFTTAWDADYDPVVAFGPEAPFGHAKPGHRRLQPGMLVHVDLGIKRDGYCSDLQRTWYVLSEEESRAPDDVLAAFHAIVRALQAGFEALRSGVRGWEVDAPARAVLTEAGHEEPEFALGHQLGQSTHDGGALLGPRWPRYGNRPELTVEVDNVFTLEFALRTSAGAIGLEEDVVVTSSGARYLEQPQTELKYVQLD